MKPLGGVSVAAITPRGEQGHEVDVGATLELIDFLCGAGVQGLALLGSTGEFINLDVEERNRLVYLAVKRSRVPVLAGVAHSSLDLALHLGREACDAGAAGLLLMPPYFFRYSQEDICEYYLQFAAQLGRSAAIYLYNIPFFTNELAIETALELLQTGKFAGIKDSSGRIDYFERLRQFRETNPFSLLIGNDVIFTKARAAGADGVVSGVACAVPELLLGLDHAILARDSARIDALEAQLQDFITWLDRLPTPVGVKLAAAARGIKTGGLAVPLSPNHQRTAAAFQEWFRGWLPQVKKDAAHA